MKLAVVGKGGAGKSTVAATIARAWAAGGRQVLAVDLDTNPGLALSLGLGLSDAGLPEEASRRPRESRTGIGCVPA